VLCSSLFRNKGAIPKMAGVAIYSESNASSLCRSGELEKVHGKAMQVMLCIAGPKSIWNSHAW
jgi:hypothetical protein